MKTRFFTPLFAIGLIFTSCDSTGNDNDKNQSESSSSQNIDQIFKENDNRKIYECDATKKSEENFADTFITYNKNDIKYADSINYSKLSVKNIEDIFDHARSLDPSVDAKTKMTLPPQEIWDEMDTSQKVLYLVNSERCARGIRIFEGIDTTLEENAVKPYAQYIASNVNDFESNPHEANGKTLQQRVEQNTNFKLGVNAESLFENIATFTVASSIGYQKIYESEAKAVYGWLYLDKSQNYGHRKSLLATGLIDNWGENEAEGIIAAFTSKRSYKKGDLYYKSGYIVMDGVDPASTWNNDLQNIKRVPLYR